MEDINKTKLAPNDLGIETLTTHEVKLLDEFAARVMSACIISPRSINYRHQSELVNISYKYAIYMIAERRKIIE